MHSARLRRVRKLSKIVIGAGVVAALTAMGSPAMAAGDPFPDNPPTVFIAYDTPVTSLATLSGSTSTGFGLTTFPTSGSLSYNALGFNPLDGYLYAIDSDSNLVQIDLDGEITTLGPVDFPTGVAQINQGTFGLDDGWEGKYFVRALAGLGTLLEVDLATRSVISHPLHGEMPNVSDIVYRNGYIWGYDGGDLQNRIMYRIDLSDDTLPVDSFDVSSLGLPSQAYGGQWLYGNGDLGLTGNSTGDIFQIEITDGETSEPTFRVVSTAKGEPTTNNDAASILGGPADLGITKTGDASFRPGEVYNYQISVSNNGPGSSSGSVVTDILPAGLQNPASATLGCEINAGTLTCGLGALAAGDSFSIVVTGTAAADATTTSLTNSASVRGNEADLNPDNNTASYAPQPELAATGTDMALLYPGLALLIAGAVALMTARRRSRA